MTAPRIFTITLNPAIDQTISVGQLCPGQVHRAKAQQIEAGGKGLGVAVVAASLGLPVIASGWLGAQNDAVFVAALAKFGIEDAMLRLPGSTRTNIKIADMQNACSTDINLPGLDMAPAALARAQDDLLADLRLRVRRGDWCELAGSLPPGADAQIWLKLACVVVAAGANLAIDTTGELLRELLPQLKAQGVPVAFIKPNRAEFEQLVGRALLDWSDVGAAAQALCQTQGLRQLAISLGADGAIIATANQCWHASAPRVPVATTVGAGDAMVAGTLAALVQGQVMPQAALFGMACAAARIQRIAPGLPALAEVETLARAISVQEIICH